MTFHIFVYESAPPPNECACEVRSHTLGSIANPRGQAHSLGESTVPAFTNQYIILRSILKVAEVRSRFENIEEFITMMGELGFELICQVT